MLYAFYFHTQSPVRMFQAPFLLPPPSRHKNPLHVPPPQVRRMIVGACEAWLRDYRMDGLRFDSIKDVPMDCVQVGRQSTSPVGG